MNRYSTQEWMILNHEVKTGTCTSQACVTLQCSRGIVHTKTHCGIGDLDALCKAINVIVNISNIKVTSYNAISLGIGTDSMVQTTIVVRDGTTDETLLGTATSKDVLTALAYSYVDAINKVVYARLG